jgi:DNA-binding MarR family transcriptional regulator
MNLSPTSSSSPQPSGADALAPDMPTPVVDALKLDSYWPYQITVLADRIARQTSTIVKREAGLNLSQWRVLAAIAEKPGRTAAEVVTMTPMDKGIVSRATKGLLTGGYLVRHASQADGRVSHLFLTEAGVALYTRLRPAVEAVSMPAGELLPHDQQDAFCSLVRQLADALPDAER